MSPVYTYTVVIINLKLTRSTKIGWPFHWFNGEHVSCICIILSELQSWRDSVLLADAIERTVVTITKMTRRLGQWFVRSSIVVRWTWVRARVIRDIRICARSRLYGGSDHNTHLLHAPVSTKWRFACTSQHQVTGQHVTLSDGATWARHLKSPEWFLICSAAVIV